MLVPGTTVPECRSVWQVSPWVTYCTGIHHWAFSTLLTKRAQHILDNSLKVHHGKQVLTLCVTEWSDGFEPTLSIKGNRVSCWIKTMMMLPPPNQLHSLTHTYPIALGHDWGSHEEIEEKFAAEWLSFGHGELINFYHGALQHDVRVQLELLVSLQDQPERLSANYIMLGTSSYTAWWGLALDFLWL